MPVTLDQTTPADLDAIAALLCAAFGAAPGAPFVDRRLLQWKYLDGPAGCGAPRSYVLRQGSAVVAHCAVSPLTLRVPGSGGGAPRGLSAFCFMDWAGGRQLPGAGLMLMKKLMAQVDVAIVAGGSDATRAIVPKLGFREAQALDTFARVVKPVRQARGRPRTSLLSDGARLARNAAWSLAPWGTLPSGWRAVPLEPASAATPPHHLLTVVTPEHGPALLEYWLRCPAAPVSGFSIRRDGTAIGHFLVSRAGGQARLADLRVASAAPADWEAACRLAARTAALDPEAHEIVGLASTAEMRRALSACGFRPRGATPLFVSDPKGLLTGAPPLLWSLIDDDAAYVFDPQHPYRT